MSYKPVLPYRRGAPRPRPVAGSSGQRSVNEFSHQAPPYISSPPPHYNPTQFIRLATPANHGLMSIDSFDKLEKIEGNANNYSLPIATGSSLGGFKVGSGLIIDNGVLSLDKNDHLIKNTVSITGEQTISGNKTFSNDLVINGNLIVNGNTETTTNTTIKDSFIELLSTCGFKK